MPLKLERDQQFRVAGVVGRAITLPCGTGIILKVVGSRSAKGPDARQAGPKTRMPAKIRLAGADRIAG